MKNKYFLIIFLLFFIINGCSTTSRKHISKEYVKPAIYEPKINYNAKNSANINKRYNINTVTTFNNRGAQSKGKITIDAISKYKMLQYLNMIRTQPNACSGPVNKPLKWNMILEKSSGAHATDMAINRFVSHDGSGTSYDVGKTVAGIGSKFYERILALGYPAIPHTIFGETLGVIKTNITGDDHLFPNFKREVGKFLNSPHHCSIIMNPRYDYVGMSAYKDGNSYYFVFDFANSL